MDVFFIVKEWKCCPDNLNIVFFFGILAKCKCMAACIKQLYSTVKSKLRVHVRSLSCRYRIMNEHNFYLSGVSESRSCQSGPKPGSLEVQILWSVTVGIRAVSVQTGLCVLVTHQRSARAVITGL
ncbi:uncharacterized protein LOC113282158 [Papaver somniferum]|uniref:uncharacterized protein LOC113282158 n=1 Tax=Papaver somniferum TaxID=3469 RepID=UPI000E702039|nr:uncharacterized protein LOC113282158 [Papaver somniferum]